MDAKSIRLENLRLLIQEIGSQKKLAHQAGVNPAYLSQILSKRTPRTMGDDVARRLERGMKKSHGWMDTLGEPVSLSRYQSQGQQRSALREVDDVRSGYGRHRTPEGVDAGPRFVANVPLVSWVTAGQWAEVVDNFHPGDADEWVDTTKKVGEGAFALRVRGDSMEPKCPDGAVIIVDPEQKPENGSLVVVRLENDREATFKKLVIDGRRRYLEPLNTRYPVLEITGPATICGVVRQVLIDLD